MLLTHLLSTAPNTKMKTIPPLLTNNHFFILNQKTNMKTIFQILTVALVFLSPLASFAQTSGTLIEDVTVVQLSQVPGEYETTELNLPPGKYVFEVTNRNVDKGLGFYLTPATAADQQVANSGLSKLVGEGETARTGVVELTAGEYQYSCPLNPTPHYTITVEERM